MSNRRQLVSPVASTLRQLDGARMAGGCDHCNAYQVITAPAYGHPNIANIRTYHDDWCPFLASLERSNR